MPEPWIKVKVGIVRSDKLAELPNDSARIGYVWMLLEAKTQRQLGQFVSRAHLVDILGPRGRYVDDYLAVGLLHVAPLDCGECAERHPDARPGALVVHDYRKEQRPSPAQLAWQGRSSGAQRTERWRLRKAVLERDGNRCRYCGDPDPDDLLVAEHVDPDGPSDLTNLVASCRSCNKRKGHRTPEAAGMTLLPVPGDASRDASRRASRNASHANGVTHLVTRHRDVTLTRAGDDGDSDSDDSLSREDRSPTPSRVPSAEREDVQALLDRGWKRVTPAQRTLLDEVLDRHDVTGPTWAASIIRATPQDVDPVAAVLEADAAWQQARRREADAAEAEWQATKDADRARAEGIAADLFGGQP